MLMLMKKLVFKIQMYKFIINGENGNVGKILSQQDNVILYNQQPNIHNVNTFIHLASKSQDKDFELIESNILYLKEMISFCEKNNIANFIFISAVSIYGEKNKNNVNENDSCKNTQLYGLTKLMGEEILKMSNLNILILRLPMILTDNKSNGVLNRIILKLENNEKVVLYNSDKIFNNFIGMNDLINFINIYKFKNKIEILNLATSQQLSLKEIVLYLKNLLKSSSQIEFNNEKKKFFNISISRAQKYYAYEPQETKEILYKWILQRKGQ